MIKLENITAYYDKIEILHNISFELKDGENLSIIGTNGSGKTTLLRCIINNIKFDGEVYLNDKSIKKMKRLDIAKEIGMLSQITNVYFNYTVFETVLMGRYVYQKGRFYLGNNKKDIIETERALNIVGMYNLKDREINTLSGGQLQRVFLAKIIAQNPKVILLDEPTNHLDLSYKIELINFLKRWSKEENKTIIGVLHDINLAMLLADKTLIIKDGRLIAFGQNNEILTSNILNEIYNIDIKDFMIKSLKKWENI